MEGVVYVGRPKGSKNKGPIVRKVGGKKPVAIVEAGDSLSDLKDHQALLDNRWCIGIAKVAETIPTPGISIQWRDWRSVHGELELIIVSSLHFRELRRAMEVRLPAPSYRCDNCQSVRLEPDCPCVGGTLMEFTEIPAPDANPEAIMAAEKLEQLKGVEQHRYDPFIRNTLVDWAATYLFDHKWREVELYGVDEDSEVLQKLAARGMKFINCSPSASLPYKTRKNQWTTRATANQSQS